MYIATIDTGTTNTRVKIWNNKKVISRSFEEVGVRDTAITGSRTKLQNGVKNAINTALKQANITLDDVGLILASGMITSNVGLHEVPHVWAPAGIKELAGGMVEMKIDGVVDRPIWFVPGVKNDLRQVSIDNCEAMDIMRGEEVETFGILESLNIKGPAVIVLPGSHSKFVKVDEENRITGCVTTLAGELLSAITKNTILANSLNNSFVENINEEMLVKGAVYSKKVGLNRVCFTVRILDLFTEYVVNDKANFLLGAVLGADLLVIKNSDSLKFSPESSVIIGGSKVLKKAFEILIKNDHYFTGKIEMVDDEFMKDMAGFGAIEAAKARGLI